MIAAKWIILSALLSFFASCDRGFTGDVPVNYIGNNTQVEKWLYVGPFYDATEESINRVFISSILGEELTKFTKKDSSSYSDGSGNTTKYLPGFTILNDHNSLRLREVKVQKPHEVMYFSSKLRSTKLQTYFFAFKFCGNFKVYINGELVDRVKSITFETPCYYSYLESELHIGLNDILVKIETRNNHNAFNLKIYYDVISLSKSIATHRREIGLGVESHPNHLRKAFHEKIDIIKDPFLTQLKEMDALDSYSAYMPSDQEVERLKAAMDLLPTTLTDFINENIYVVYFINNLDWNGRCDYLIDSNLNQYAVIAFDSDIFEKSDEDRLTIKENSYFEDDATLPITIKVRFTKEISPFLFILLHEVGHAIDYKFHLTPYYKREFKYLFNVTDSTSPFIEDVWQFPTLAEKHYQNHIQIFQYILRPNAKLKIPQKYQKELYQEFRGFPFVSFYSTKNWMEDFAEYFTYYYLKKWFDVDILVELFENENLVLSINQLDSVSPNRSVILEKEMVRIFGEGWDDFN